MQVYDETCLALCEGQYLDISFERRTDVTVDEYLEMISKKTAALIGASIETGAMMASDDPAVVEAYRRLGRDLGMAFQIADDLKGSFWAAADSGKSAAGDIRKRKKTFPVVWAMQNAGADEVERLIAIYQPAIRATDGTTPPDGESLLSDELVEEVLAILERSGARAATEQEARRYRDLALADARALPVPAEGVQGVEDLRTLVESMISA
jgi:geranylgeranyl diphosphate synthase type I